MKKIKLGKSEKFALIDDEDFESVNLYNWRCQISKIRPVIYVRTNVKVNEKLVAVKLHNFLMNPPEGFVVDHKDGDGLNNQRENLRICTDSRNKINVGLRKDNTSGYKGVDFVKRLNKYRSQIRINRKTKYIGIYQTAEEAARSYDETATKLFGEFAYLNFPKNP